ncbi:Acetylornithine deacetylase [compost metagenome]
MIAGGVQTNVIPDRCAIDVDIRTVPPQNHASLLEEIENRLLELKKLNPQYRYEIEPLLDRSPVNTDPKDELIAAALEITGQSPGELKGVPYYTDGSVLHHEGKPPILIYGPGDEKLAHQPDEWVDIDAYMASITFYRELAIRFLGLEQA